LAARREKDRQVKQPKKREGHVFTWQTHCRGRHGIHRWKKEEGSSFEEHGGVAYIIRGKGIWRRRPQVVIGRALDNEKA